MIDRRTFLAGIATTAAVAAAPFAAIAETLCPTLWCDGEHDDGPALRAIFNGRSHRRADSTSIVDVRVSYRVDHVFVMGGHFTVKSPVVAPRDKKIIFTSNFVKCGGGGCVVFGPPDRHFVSNCYFIGVGDDMATLVDRDRYNIYKSAST